MADPTKKILISPENIKKCETYAGLGLTQADMAALCDVSRKTFQRRIKDQPELADALEKGVAQATAQVTQSLSQSAVKKGNVTAQIFWLKCRKGWNEMDQVDTEDPEHKVPMSLVANEKES